MHQYFSTTYYPNRKETVIEHFNWYNLPNDEKQENLFTNLLANKRNRWRWSKFDSDIVKRWNEVSRRLDNGQSITRICREMFDITAGDSFLKLNAYIQEIRAREIHLRKKEQRQMEQKQKKDETPKPSQQKENWLVYRYVKGATTFKQQYRRLQILLELLDKSEK